MPLPLYPTLEPQGVELAAPADVTKACKLCPLYAKARAICIGADGEPGGLLVVGESPSRTEDAWGRPMVGASGDLVRKIVAKHWNGPVVYDLAVRCISIGAPTTKSIAACSGYLRQTIIEAQPKRIIALGPVAALALIGRKIATFKNRRSVGWLLQSGPSPIPVCVCTPPYAALRNRFVRQWLDEDIAWAANDYLYEPPLDGMAIEVRTLAQAHRIAARIRRLGRKISFDVEAVGRMWESSYRILCIGLTVVGEYSTAVWPEESLNDASLRSVLLDILTDPSIPKVGQNVKYDWEAILCAYGVEVENVVADTRLRRKLLESEADTKLDIMSDLVGMGGHKAEAQAAKAEAVRRVKKLAKDGKSLDCGADLERYIRMTLKLPTDADADDGDDEVATISRKNITETWSLGFIAKPVLHRYNARDCVSTAQLEDLLSKQIESSQRLKRTWDLLVQPAIIPAAQVEAWGVAADKEAISAFDRYLEVRLHEYLERLRGHADIKWTSPEQVADYFFKKLGLVPPELTDKGAASTKKAVLKKLQDKVPAAADLLEFRRLGKLRGTYASGMLWHVRADGRIHGSFNIDGARTGRTSFSDPNLQNIPRSTSVEGKMARDVFIATPLDVFGVGENVLVQLDYSQLELRVAAMLSGDPLMKQIFVEGVDYHLRTAMMVADIVWKMRPEDIEAEYMKTGKSEQRTQAKAFNFGVLYGEGDKALAEAMGVSVSKARQVREAIMGKFKKLAAFCNNQVNDAQRFGEVWTTWDGQFARRRSMWRIAEPDDKLRSVAEHGSWNTPVQGTASDYCIASLVALVNWIKGSRFPARLVLAVHDSLMFEVPVKHVAELVEKSRSVMQSWPSEGVPLVVDVEVGPSWGSLEPYGKEA